MKTDIVENVPSYATCYLLYGDNSALTDDDISAADNFEKSLLAEGRRLVSPIDGTENEFCPYPAFGLACSTIDWTVEILN